MKRHDQAYELVPREEDEQGEVLEASRKYRNNIIARYPVGSLLSIVLGFALVALATKIILVATKKPIGEDCDDVRDGFGCAPERSHYWGQYSPYYSVPSEISSELLTGTCKLTFAQVLSRHGARDPTIGRTILYGATVARIQTDVQSFTGSYSFLKDYKYSMGADQLTVFGEQQMVNSGIAFFDRYKELANSSVPFFRASGQQRVINSGLKFAEGYHQARRNASLRDESFPYPMVIIGEELTSNNTMSNELCTNFRNGPASSIGRTAQQEWLDIFAPVITSRLNAGMPGANLTSAETIYLMDLCPFDTVASPSGALSPFCTMFTEDEWRQYDYFETLGKWYGYSNGNPLAPTQGVGYANELIARLTKTPVKDHTSVNHTLDDTAKTFPLNYTLYADFSHDNDMLTIYSALGLYNTTSALSNSSIQDTTATHGFSASWTVPFAARMYVEKWACGGGDEEEMVRILVNGRVVPLSWCDSNKRGLCKLQKFVDGLSFAREGGRWEECFN